MADCSIGPISILAHIRLRRKIRNWRYGSGRCVLGEVIYNLPAPHMGTKTTVGVAMDGYEHKKEYWTVGC